MRVALVAALVAALPSTTWAEAPRRQLRVCADPNNLPFSNARGEGLENALARLVAHDLHAELTYTWLPQRRGFVRNTLKANRCDVMMEVPAGYERTATTQPYYRSTYVFVSRKDRKLAIRSFDDPALRGLKIGVQIVGDDYANPPPAAALGRRGLARNVVGYSVYGDYSQPMPLGRIVEAVERGDIDVAVVWGPLGGWMAKHARVPLEVTPVAARDDGPGVRFVFDIAMGVRRGDRALRDELDALLRRDRQKIDRLLRDYGVPLVAAR